MKTDELNYELPAELIAQQPSAIRSQSRLLVLEKSENRLTDTIFSEIGQYLRKGDCLVLNNTKVLPARFYGKRKSGAKLEGLFLCEKAGRWEIMLKNSRKVKAGEEIILTDVKGNQFCTAIARPCENQKWTLEVNGSVEEVLGKIGFAPLPPYIKRDAEDNRNLLDRQRYQTVFAEASGAVAAPTAGLHFTDELLNELNQKGVKRAFVTLHTGAGTFKPVTTETLQEHKIHSERYNIDQANAEIINKTKAKGGRIIAVGTTSVRTLETVAENGLAKADCGDTRLFIMPGYEYKIVDAMITNFHLPKSTLLALVGAFADVETILAAYKHAIKEEYRFYSYGDAMLII